MGLVKYFEGHKEPLGQFQHTQDFFTMNLYAIYIVHITEVFHIIVTQRNSLVSFNKLLSS